MGEIAPSGVSAPAAVLYAAICPVGNEVWSPLEYTCHVRDVLRVQGERLALALVTEEPEFTPMGRD
ncbi:hypothetical protein OG799_08560 [Micromonospora sp. NBC_00898]|uniref:hypothetical protein n=1 Tax=Micromonospora sp. NBC_00898 TaxID=2975981 RepID=UPI003867129F|nr:hypothetical protein OG799_08560 [Micromonospora sp. NBC_00898]